ncbi:ABC transporter ATP-binding protein [Nitrincola tapanii]|uniref:ABC transporter ATP-binding protein n=1 Tax=Nitrincola tapanii TaxID=1708751 RepID=A0A5A9W6S9_9GAMM|nr:ABC transporter ATP-binding protein [Nitrincola tapanii]KAA0876402.1 ABC transporter ATP-binding protein [Nitrincola tapanii]
MLELHLHAKVLVRPILGEIRLSLDAGERVCLLGPSGIGKTTLMNILAGLDTEFSGQIRFSGGQPKIGYMFQEPRLLPWRTLRQNLALVCHQPALIDELLHAVDLHTAQDLYPNQLSLGMARRAALARCLVIQPDLILLDEPLVSLDPKSAEQMRQLILRLHQTYPQTRMLMVTHDPVDAEVLADRVLILGGQPAQIRAELDPQAPDFQQQLHAYTA